MPFARAGKGGAETKGLAGRTVAGRSQMRGRRLPRLGEVRVFGDRLGPRTDMQFFIHAPDVGIDRGHADVEPLGDFLVKVTARQQFEDFLFAG